MKKQNWSEKARTREIVGKTVNRVILDRNERVILGNGEMITHESIERARDAGVLDELYAAAWAEEPRPVGEEKFHTPGELRLKREEEVERKRKYS